MRRARCKGPRTLSRTTIATLDCEFVDKAHCFVVLKNGGHWKTPYLAPCFCSLSSIKVHRLHHKNVEVTSGVKFHFSQLERAEKSFVELQRGASATTVFFGEKKRRDKKHLNRLRKILQLFVVVVCCFFASVCYNKIKHTAENSSKQIEA